jgi:hypothetical protein
MPRWRGVMSKVDDIKNYKITWSDLSSKVADDEHTIEVHIFRGVADTSWTLEIIDENDESRIWKDKFATDHEAWKAFELALESEGIEAFVPDKPRTVH